VNIMFSWQPRAKSSWEWQPCHHHRRGHPELRLTRCALPRRKQGTRAWPRSPRQTIRNPSTHA
jgi:hypothetical protein